MKFSIASAALLLASTASAAALAKYPTPYDVPRVDGRQFRIDGKKQFFAGTNTWWMSHLTSDADVDYAMKQIAASNLKITRIWGFGNVNAPSNDTGLVYFQVLQEGLNGNGSAINWGPNGIARLDSAIRHAEKYNVKVVLPMVNNWNDLGGINSYSQAFGCNATTFYTHEGCYSAYTNWVKFVVNRYKNSPAIFSWELGNEPRCKFCDTSVLTKWAGKVSTMIKKLDPLHMVTLGDEGWFAGETGKAYSGMANWTYHADWQDPSYAYAGVEGIDFVQNLMIPTLDYGTFHLYPDSWKYNETWGNTWISQHDDAGRKANKPVIFEEYGTEADKRTVIGEWQQTVLKTNVAADQWWQFSTDLPSGINVFDIHAIAYNTTKGSLYDFLVLQHAKQMLAKRVR